MELNEMELNEAIEIIAGSIWHGEQKDLNYSLIPSYYKDLGPSRQEFYEASDLIIDKFGATHYACYWGEPGKTIIIELGKGDGFGACLDVYKLPNHKYEITFDSVKVKRT